MEETSGYVCIFSKCCVCAKSLHSCLTLCDLMDCSPPGSSVHGILQARAPEWAAMPSSRGSSWPRKWTQISCNSCIAGRFFTTQPPRKPIFPKYIFPTYIYPKYKHIFPKDMETRMGWELGLFLQFITKICQPSKGFLILYLTLPWGLSLFQVLITTMDFRCLPWSSWHWVLLFLGSLSTPWNCKPQSRSKGFILLHHQAGHICEVTEIFFLWVPKHLFKKSSFSLIRLGTIHVDNSYCNLIFLCFKWYYISVLLFLVLLYFHWNFIRHNTFCSIMVESQERNMLIE